APFVRRVEPALAGDDRAAAARRGLPRGRCLPHPGRAGRRGEGSADRGGHRQRLRRGHGDVAVSVVVPRRSAEPAWLAGVRLRLSRRVLWCRELWERNRYVDEDGLAISHSEVELVLVPREELAIAEAEFLASDEQARLLTAELEALPEEGR